MLLHVSFRQQKGITLKKKILAITLRLHSLECRHGKFSWQFSPPKCVAGGVPVVKKQSRSQLP